MRKYGGIACLLLSVLIGSQAQEAPVLRYWPYHEADAKNSLYRAICADAFSSLQKRGRAVASLTGEKEWLAYQEQIKEKLHSVIGPFPEKTPLHPELTGVLQKDSYRVEKLVLESRPGYLMTAALFIPHGGKTPKPAIIYASGHSDLAFRSDTYQHVILNLVKKGFVVLAFDPVGQGERQLYLDDQGRSAFRQPTHQHSYPGAQAFLAGASLANYFIWDGIRCVDYLLTRPEVDGERIGITGRSGGGTQTAYIAAFDERIKAAAPENYITGFEYLLKSGGPQDAEQNIPGLLAQQLDLADLIIIRYPKPYLISATTRDIFSIQGVLETSEEVKRMYAAGGEADQFGITIDDAAHASTLKNREATYAFFQKHLQMPGSSQDEPTVKLSLEELKITRTGQVLSSYAGALSLQELIARDGRRAPLDPVALPARVLAATGYAPAPEKFKTVFSGRFNEGDLNREHYVLEGNNSLIPLKVLYPKAIDPDQVVLIINHQPETDSVWLGRLLASGKTLVLADVKGIGELANGYMKGDSFIQNHSYNQWFGALLNQKSIIGYQMQDLDPITHFIRHHLQADKIEAIGKGGPGLTLLHYQYLKGAFHKLTLLQTPYSYQQAVIQEQYAPEFTWYWNFGAARFYDPLDLSDEKVWWVAPVDPAGKVEGRQIPLERGSILDRTMWMNSLLKP